MSARRSESHKAHSRDRGAPAREEAATSDTPRSKAAGPVDAGAPLTPAQDEAVPDESAQAAEAEKLRERWLRAEADLQNFRRRAARDREESSTAAEESVLLDVIQVLDDLDRAIDAAREGGADDAWMRGVDLVAARIRDVLSRRGVEELDPVGEPFDPAFHEALLEVDATGETVPGDVVQVILKGYRRGTRALRAARVAVARVAEGGDA